MSPDTPLNTGTPLGAGRRGATGLDQAPDRRHRRAGAPGDHHRPGPGDSGDTGGYPDRLQATAKAPGRGLKGSEGRGPTTGLGTTDTGVVAPLLETISKREVPYAVNAEFGKTWP